MKTLDGTQIELIDAILAERDVGGLTPAIFEKDIHVTDALLALLRQHFVGATLYFCGGTSLSKAYGMLERMSEDIDLKVVLDSTQAASQSARRTRLSCLKGEIAECLLAVGFVEDETKRKALNANHYFASGWVYRPVYDHDATLRPELKLEVTARKPMLSPQSVPLGYLIDRFSGQQSGGAGTVLCVSPAETLAEKVLSFLRRYEQFKAGAMQQAWDETLVRHIYDVCLMHSQQPSLVDEACTAFASLIAVDQQEFGSQFPAFLSDPKQVLQSALAAAGQDSMIVAQYENKLLPLVFGAQKPSFGVAYATFNNVAAKLISVL